MATSGISETSTDSFLHDSERFLTNWKGFRRKLQK